MSGWVRRLVKDLFALPENVVDDWDLIDERTVLNRILEQKSLKKPYLVHLRHIIQFTTAITVSDNKSTKKEAQDDPFLSKVSYRK